MQEASGSRPDDRLLAVTTPVASTSPALELFLPLLGRRAASCWRAARTAADGAAAGRGCSPAGASPSCRRRRPPGGMLLDGRLAGRRAGCAVLCGGEALPRDLAGAARRAAARAAGTSTARPRPPSGRPCSAVAAGEAGAVPIGRPDRQHQRLRARRAAAAGAGRRRRASSASAAPAWRAATSAGRT